MIHELHPCRSLQNHPPAAFAWWIQALVLLHLATCKVCVAGLVLWVAGCVHRLVQVLGAAALRCYDEAPSKLGFFFLRGSAHCMDKGRADHAMAALAGSWLAQPAAVQLLPLPGTPLGCNVKVRRWCLPASSCCAVPCNGCLSGCMHARLYMKLASD